jgi:hypothetical protein
MQQSKEAATGAPTADGCGRVTCVASWPAAFSIFIFSAFPIQVSFILKPANFKILFEMVNTK